MKSIFYHKEISLKDKEIAETLAKARDEGKIAIIVNGKTFVLTVINGFCTIQCDGTRGDISLRCNPDSYNDFYKFLSGFIKSNVFMALTFQEIAETLRK